ncbi:MAG: elongation factor G [Candidatus Polarisedimenticolia bacterium]
MKVYDTANIRNVAFVGHGGSGKTSLVSALLYAAKATDKLGSVAEGTAPTDFDPEEVERKVSMAVAVACAEQDGVKLNFIDAPGFTSFIGEAYAALRASDAAIIAVHALDGIGVQTEKMFEEAEKDNLPLMFAVSHLDRDRADFDKSVAELSEAFGRKVMPISLPINAGPQIKGAVCLVSRKAFLSKPGAAEAEVADVPADMVEAVNAAREALLEMVAECDDELMNSFLENGTLTDEEFGKGLRKAIAVRGVFPVFAVAGTAMAGVHPLLAALVAAAPSPFEGPTWTATAEDGQSGPRRVGDADFCAQVFKTIIDPFAGRVSYFRVVSGSIAADAPSWNSSKSQPEKMGSLSVPRGKAGDKIPEVKAGDIAFVTKLKETRTGDTLTADKARTEKLAPINFPKPVIAYAVHGEAKGDEEKIAEALKKLAEEDPTIRLDRDPRSHELMLSGLGADHVKFVCEKAAKRYNCKAQLEKPKVPYLETITKKSSQMYRHKKQTGGAGQFAEVHMRIEPLPRGAGFKYDSEIFGGTISRGFWPSIEKGVRMELEKGVIAGYPMVDVRAVIFDGKEHPVDSKDIAFQIAGREVFKKAVAEAGAVVLEPIMQVVVTVPDEFMGDILGDLTRRRGKVQGSDNAGGKTRVRALVPMAEMLEYSATLKSVTSDRGSYTMELDHYEKVPSEIQAKLMADFKPQETED